MPTRRRSGGNSRGTDHKTHDRALRTSKRQFSKQRTSTPFCKYGNDGFSFLKAISQFLDLKDLCQMRIVSRWFRDDFKKSHILDSYLVTVENPGVSRIPFWLQLVEDDLPSQIRGSEPLNSNDPLDDNPQIEAEIWRDVHRTFPQHPLFRQVGGAGQTLLTEILKQCASMNGDVGYCQGMNYVAAVLLTEALELNGSRGASLSAAATTVADTPKTQKSWTIARVQEAYQCVDSTLQRRIVRIMNALINNPRYCMYGLWTNGVPDLRLRLYQVGNLCTCPCANN